MLDPADFWERLKRSAEANRLPAAPAAGNSGSSTPSERWRWPKETIRRLDILAWVIWAYFFIKVFIWDVDRAVLGALSPSATFLLDYRVIFYLLLIALLALFVRRRRWRIFYVVFFPFVVIFQKVPAFLLRHRSWSFMLSSLRITTAVLGDVRYHATTKPLAAVAILLIVLLDGGPLVAASVAYLLALLVWTFWRLFRRIFSEPSFTAVQARWIRALTESEGVRSSVRLKDEYRRSDVLLYSDAQVNAIAMAISLGVLVNKALLLWAYNLQQYGRKYSPAVTFGIASFIYLFVCTAVVLTFINWGMVKLTPHQFAFDSGSSLFAVFAYSVSSLAFGQLGGMHPIGDLSTALALFSGLLGGLVLVSVGLNLILIVRRELDDQTTKELVVDLRRRAHEFAAFFVEQYGVGVDEARQRLEQIGTGITFLLRYFASIPDDFVSGEAPD